MLFKDYCVLYPLLSGLFAFSIFSDKTLAAVETCDRLAHTCVKVKHNFAQSF